MYYPNRPKKDYIVNFSTGMIFGLGFAYLLINFNSSTPTFQQSRYFYKGIRQLDHGHDQHTSFENVPSMKVSSHLRDEEMHKGEDIEARILAEEVRVLCWIMTSPWNHKAKASHVKQTWGKRCTKLLFMSSEDDEELPSIGLKNVHEGRDHLWAKTKEAFRYVYEHHFDDADWFLKADDDTYVIVENLRFLLQDYDSNYPIYFGCRLKGHNKQGYMSGGAGYVLSKEALRKFVEEALPDGDKCKQSHDGAEDYEIGKCLENVGVEALDSRDGYGRFRFLPFVPKRLVIPNRVLDETWKWYQKYTYYPLKDGMDCCSDTAISFHYVSAEKMYVMEYLIYHLRPFGINSVVRELKSLEDT